MADATEDVTADLVDLTQVSLKELRSLNHPILSDMVSRVAEEAKNSVEATAGFQAAI